MIFRILVNDKGNVKAIQRGFSFFAFFFTGLYALFMGLYSQFFIAVGVVFILRFIMVDFELIYKQVFGILFCLSYGIEFYKWLYNKAIKKGYLEKMTIDARSPNAAIRLYNESCKKEQVERSE